MPKTVLITGTSSGFGRASAHLFANKGWNVVATMRDLSQAGDLKNVPNVLIERLDVQELSTIERALAAGVSRFRSIDVLVNNAGYGQFGIFEGTPRSSVQDQFDVNVFGVMDTTRAILPHFRAKQDGIIVNVSSGAGIFGLPMISLYTASKFALEGFSESLSYELASQGIVVKIVEPGGVLSTQFGARNALEASSVERIDDYAGFQARTLNLFKDLSAAATATSEDVALVIFQAASDGTNQLRYVATNDIQPLVRARRETSEAQYMQHMRTQFQRDY
ncbi:SDR family oxidoreductase [Rhodanobacter sp. BL-MT-08]